MTVGVRLASVDGPSHRPGVINRGNPVGVGCWPTPPPRPHHHFGPRDCPASRRSEHEHVGDDPGMVRRPQRRNRLERRDADPVGLDGEGPAREDQVDALGEL
jgi:hypothetical protein